MKLSNFGLAARTIRHAVLLATAAPKNRIASFERYAAFVERAHIQNPDYAKDLAKSMLSTLNKISQGLLDEVAADDALWVEARLVAKDEPEIDRLLSLISRLEVIANS